MMITIRKALLLSFTCLSIVSISPQSSFGADPVNNPTDQPAPGPKQSTWKKIFGQCMGCLKTTQEVMEDIEDITPVVIDSGKVIADQVEQVVDKNTRDKKSKTRVVRAVNEQEKVKNMTSKVSKKTKKKDKNNYKA